MNRVQEAFQGKKAFIPFITCGDPDLETTEQLVYAMEQEGASIIELGIPFSDPTAEGPVIQEANLRALSGGVTTEKVFGNGRENQEEFTDSPCVYDVCECRIFLRNRAFHKADERDGDGRADPSGRAF